MIALSRPLTTVQLRGNALVAWGVAVGLALAAQLMFTPLEQLGAGRVLFLLSILVTVVGIVRWNLASLLPGRDLPIAPPHAIDLQQPRVRLGLGLIALGGLGALITIPLIGAVEGYVVGGWLWVLTLALVLGGAWIMENTTIRVPVPDRAGRVELALVLGLLLLAALLRFPAIDTIPPDVHGDEALTGSIVQRGLAGGEQTNLFTAGSALGTWMHGLPMRFGTNDLHGLRTGSAIEGILCVLLLYLLARRWFGTRTALLASAFLAVAQWHIHFSRDGITYMQAELFTLLLFYLFFRALETQAWTDWVLMGFVAVFCLHTYPAGRTAPLLVGLYVLYRGVRESAFRQAYWRGLVAVGLAVLIFNAPIVPALLTQPDRMTSRLGAVWLLTPENLHHAREAYRVDGLPAILWIQTQHTLEGFNLSGERSEQYFRLGAPLLDFWTAALLVPGAVLVTGRAASQTIYFFLATWIWLMLVLGSILTIDAPFAPRLIAVIPALMLLPAIVLESGWRGVERSFGAHTPQVAAGAAAGVVLLLALVANFHDYFGVHIVQYQPAQFNTTLARRILAENDRYRFYLMVPGASLGYDTIRFLVPVVDGADAGEPSFPLPVRDATPGKGAEFILLPEGPTTESRLAQLHSLYPSGREEQVESARGVPLFITYVVEADALARPSSYG